MQIITSIAELQQKIDECNTTLVTQSDDAMRALFHSFRMDLSQTLPQDPFSPDYRGLQNAIYQMISGRDYAVQNERTQFDLLVYQNRPFPYYLQNTSTAGHHLLAIAFLLCKLQLPAGARILEFGPGWGNTTIELARLGMNVTAVDIEPRFCEIIRTRAAQHGVDVNVVEGDFFWAESVTDPFDAVIFFECFHHCDDHMRLLRALHRAVKPDGQVYFASEPIFPAYPVPWGVRMDGEALWAIRNFGWLELGFDAVYFQEALARTGWSAQRHPCQDVPWAAVWQASRSENTSLLPNGTYPPIRGNAASWDGLSVPLGSASETPGEVARLRRELDEIYRSTSWRMTKPLRALKDAMRPGKRGIR
jgi:2-polyprenyl-3-methyl-5-hydroxy-6-metoxy-1,4-benzoquinol methylase